MHTHKHRFFTSITLFLLFCLSGCARASTARPSITLNVFAAASLTEAFTEIGQAFEAEHLDVQVRFNFAGSQQLAQQIVEGAPADVFASADYKQVDLVIQSGRIVTDRAEMFARNLLVVIYPQDNPAGLTQLQDLARPGVRLVLADQSVPVGQYTRDFLEKAAQSPAFDADYAANVLKNVVSYDVSVKSVLNKVVLGEADGGIVYVSDITAENAAKVGRIDIPNELNALAAYFIAPLQDGSNPEAAQAFVAFVRKQGQAILTKHGLLAGE